MHGNILPVPAGQAAPTLAELAATVREEHAGVIAGFSDAIRHAIRCGQALNLAEDCTAHGQWTDFVRSCDLNPRTARRYKQLADLAAKRSSTTDLVGLTIEGAIKKLSPPAPKATTTTPAAKTAAKVETTPGKHIIHTDIIAAWLAASPADRTKAIDSIGLDALLAAIPPAWLPLLADRLTTHQAVAPVAANPALIIPDDLTIPTFLRRENEPPPAVSITTAEVNVPKREPMPKVSKGYLPTHRDPWPANWRDLDGIELEDAIRNVERHRPQRRKTIRRRRTQLKKMRARLAELREAALVSEAAVGLTKAIAHALQYDSMNPNIVLDQLGREFALIRKNYDAPTMGEADGPPATADWDDGCAFAGWDDDRA